MSGERAELDLDELVELYRLGVEHGMTAGLMTAGLSRPQAAGAALVARQRNTEHDDRTVAVVVLGAVRELVDKREPHIGIGAALLGPITLREQRSETPEASS